MNIELRNIQIYDKLSEETTAFTASIYIEGKKVGYAKNDGQGGGTDYNVDNYHNQEHKQLIEKAEQYCLQLEPLKLDGYGIHEGGKSVSIPMNLEHFIDEIVHKAWQEKENKRFKKIMQRHQLKALLIGNDKQYKQIVFGKPVLSIENLLATPSGKEALLKSIARWKASALPHERILNTNIPKEFL